MAAELPEALLKRRQPQRVHRLQKRPKVRVLPDQRILEHYDPVVECLVVGKLSEIDLYARSHALTGEHSLPFQGLSQTRAQEQAETPFAPFRFSGEDQESSLLYQQAQRFDVLRCEDQLLLTPLQLFPFRDMKCRGERGADPPPVPAVRLKC